MAKVVRKGLGRGLSALLGDDRPIIEDAVAPTEVDGTGRSDNNGAGNMENRSAGRRTLPIEFLERNIGQPRYHFNEAALEELALSIKEKGLLQPILVREIGLDKYQIVAGERRWRAAQKAGIHEVPVVVRELTDAEVLEVAIVENIQREDLSSIEEAAGYSKLIEEFGHTQEALSKIVGKSRSHITNLLRLLNLPQKVRDLVDSGRLSMGHARALLSAVDPITLAGKVVAEGMSVRQTEVAARAGKPSKREPRPGGHISGAGKKDADTVALEKDLSAALSMKVSIEHKGEGGTVTVSYKTLEDLDDLCSKLGVCGF